MAYEIPGPQYSLVAAADFTASQYFFAKTDASGDAVLADVASKTAGVAQNKAAVGQALSLVARGISKVVAGAAVAIGDPVSPDAAGKARTSVAADNIEGRALTAAAADGEIISVKLDSEGLAV